MKMQIDKSVLRKMANELRKAAWSRSAATMLTGAGIGGLPVVLLTVLRWVVCQGLAHVLEAVSNGRPNSGAGKRGAPAPSGR